LEEPCAQTLSGKKTKIHQGFLKFISCLEILRGTVSQETKRTGERRHCKWCAKWAQLCGLFDLIRSTPLANCLKDIRYVSRVSICSLRNMDDPGTSQTDVIIAGCVAFLDVLRYGALREDSRLLRQDLHPEDGSSLSMDLQLCRIQDWPDCSYLLTIPRLHIFWPYHSVGSWQHDLNGILSTFSWKKVVLNCKHMAAV
jgi:hypothetical protein